MKHGLHRVRNPWRENIEALATAAVLALIIRHFIFEAFQIPTGSMAPTLIGAHRTLVCSNCGHSFAADHAKPLAQGATCPNCRQLFSAEEVASSPARDFPSQQIAWVRWALANGVRALRGAARPFNLPAGGNRILVNKMLYEYRPAQRWDVLVFRFPWATCDQPNCMLRDQPVLPRRAAPARCPQCGGRDLQREARPWPDDPVERTRCADCGWVEFTRRDADRCPSCGGRLRFKNYIKRVVALPGETVRIHHGQVFIDGRIARKPPEAREQMWRFVYDSSLPYRLPDRDPAQAWNARSGAVEVSGGALSLLPGQGGEALAEFAWGITDYEPYNGNEAGNIPVADLKVEMDVDLPDEASAFRIALRENDGPGNPQYARVYEAVVETPEAGSKVRVARLLENGQDVAEPVRIEAEGRARLAFWNADGALALEWDGRKVMGVEFDRTPSSLPPDCMASGVAVAASGAPLRAARFRIWRDTYYRREMPQLEYGAGPEGYRVSPHGYFMLGDNSRNSKDSRMWGEVPADYLVGNSFVVWWPIDHIRAIQ